MVNVKVSFAIYADCILLQVYFIKTTTGLSSAVISFKAFTSFGSSATSGCSSNHSAIVSAGIIWANSPSAVTKVGCKGKNPFRSFSSPSS
mgnify:CR=1 FL=1